jgi:hypothetical protein
LFLGGEKISYQKTKELKNRFTKPKFVGLNIAVKAETLTELQTPPSLHNLQGKDWNSF